MAVRKHWYELTAPKMFGSGKVGETLAADSRQLVGRTVQVSLANISREYSKFYVKLNLKITEVDGNKAMTELMGHDVMRERVYRMVQRYVRRVDTIQDVTTKDGVKMRIKTLVILIKRVGTSKKDASRKICRESVERIVKEKNFEDIINMIIKGELQTMVRKECAKIYPVRNIEIRKTEVLSKKA